MNILNWFCCLIKWLVFPCWWEHHSQAYVCMPFAHLFQDVCVWWGWGGGGAVEERSYFSKLDKVKGQDTTGQTWPFLICDGIPCVTYLNSLITNLHMVFCWEPVQITVLVSFMRSCFSPWHFVSHYLTLELGFAFLPHWLTLAYFEQNVQLACRTYALTWTRLWLGWKKDKIIFTSRSQNLAIWYITLLRFYCI